MKRLGGWLLVVVFLAYAVVTAVTYPGRFGYVCTSEPLCYLQSLLAPHRIFDLPALAHLATALAQIAACLWLLTGVARRQRLRREQGVSSVPVRRLFSEYTAHLVFALTVLGSRIAFASDVGFAPRFVHVALLLIVGTCIVLVATAVFTRRDSGYFLSPLTFALALFCALTSAGFAFVQFDAGVFPCGEERSFCLNETSVSSQMLFVANTILPASLFLLAPLSFVIAALRVHRGTKHEALWVPWVAVAWVGVFVFRGDSFFEVPQFALHQAIGGLLTTLLIGLALRQPRS